MMTIIEKFLAQAGTISYYFEAAGHWPCRAGAMLSIEDIEDAASYASSTCFIG